MIAPLATLRGLAKTLWYLPEWLLHPLRRRAARARLEALRPRAVLFVCHGNVCRSPYAAYAFARALPERLADRIAVRSAGFVGPDRPPPTQALAAGERRGLDMRAHRSQLLSPELVGGADLVVVVSAEQARAVRARWGRPGLEVLVLGDLDPLPTDRRTIADPWNRDDRAFDDSYDRIDRCVSALVTLVAGAWRSEPAALTAASLRA